MYLQLFDKKAKYLIYMEVGIWSDLANYLQRQTSRTKKTRISLILSMTLSLGFRKRVLLNATKELNRHWKYDGRVLLGCDVVEGLKVA